MPDDELTAVRPMEPNTYERQAEVSGRYFWSTGNFRYFLVAAGERLKNLENFPYPLDFARGRYCIILKGDPAEGWVRQ